MLGTIVPHRGTQSPAAFPVGLIAGWTFTVQSARPVSEPVFQVPEAYPWFCPAPDGYPLIAHPTGSARDG